MRVFVAVELADEVKEYLSGIGILVVNKGKVILKDNFHLTLKFIGEKNEDDVKSIAGCLDEVASRHKNFMLCLDKLGVFANKYGKIIWVGVKPDSMLDDLFSDLEAVLEGIGIERDLRKFAPHITLGRKVFLQEKLIETIQVESMDILVDKISLMESVRIDGVLSYRPIYEALLRQR